MFCIKSISVSDSSRDDAKKTQNEENFSNEDEEDFEEVEENEKNYEEFVKVLAECSSNKKKTKYDIKIKPVVVDGLSETPIVGFTVLKFFSSLVKPMLVDLHFEDGTRRKFIFKEGDDLNLDLECQNWARKMNQCWELAGFTSRCYHFLIIPFDLKTGLIEFVENSMPLQKFRELDDGAVGFFQSAFGGGTQIFDYIAKVDQNASLQRYVDYFVGYYLMGVYIRASDRHHGNIMIKESGEIFHIDFGFSLGHSPPLEDLLNVVTVKTKFTRTVSKEGLIIVPVDHDMKVVIGAYLKVFHPEYKGKKMEYMKKRIIEANDELGKHVKDILGVEGIISSDRIGKLFEKSWGSKSSAVVNAMNCLYYCPRDRLVSDALKAPFGGIVYHGLKALDQYFQKPRIKKDGSSDEEEEEEEEGESEEEGEDESKDEEEEEDDDDEEEGEGEDDDEEGDSSPEVVEEEEEEEDTEEDTK